MLEAGLRMSGENGWAAFIGLVSSRALEDWAYRRGVQLDFIRPRAVGNAYINR